MGKGDDTRQQILDRALALASECGLEGLTIGMLASALGMSKSGVFAHFGAKDELQIAVLDAAAERFTANVMRPALQQARGLARLRAIFDHWIAYSVSGPLPGGCLFIAAAAEFDDKPGAVHDHVRAAQQRWRDALLKAIRLAVDTGELPADTDCEQLGFEMFAQVLAAHHDLRLMSQHSAVSRARRGLDRLLALPPLLEPARAG